MINSDFYNFAGQQYSADQSIELDRFCNGITAINVGATVCLFNGIPLNPGVPGSGNGESIAIGGNKGEVLQGRVAVQFPTGAGNVIVIQKFYLQTY